MIIKPGQQRRPRRAAAGAIVKLRKANALVPQAVDMRSVNLAAITAKIGKSHIVCQDDQKIRAPSLAGKRKGGACQESAKFATIQIHTGSFEEEIPMSFCISLALKLKLQHPALSTSRAAIENCLRARAEMHNQAG